MADERAIIGARNNADWYETMFLVHDLKYRRSPHAFVAMDAPPPYYSQLTVVSPGSRIEVLSELRDLAGRVQGTWGLKDSFCQFDMAGQGFQTLFEASWIWRSPRHSKLPTGWDVVIEERDLSLWEESWKKHGSPTEAHMFPRALLGRDNVVFLGVKKDGRFVAGCIANRSDDCAGLSNVFADPPSQTMFTQAANAVSAVFSNVPVVGYEAIRNLEFARPADFETVGQLRVLLTNKAYF